MKRALGMALLAMGMTATGLASAQSGPRPGDVEYTLGPAQHFSDSFQGEGGSSLDLSSRTGVRMGVEYFTSPKLSVGFDMTGAT